MIELRDGELVVAGPLPGGFSFRPDRKGLREAKRFQRTFTLGVRMLEDQRLDHATELGLELLDGEGQEPKRRKGRRS